MFPYPSGSLHLGHLRVYSIADTLTRYTQARTGHKPIFPMGWDAFGLPAENAAKLNDQNPHEWTKNNIIEMKKDLQEFKLDFDWNRVN
jgi:leucyl-tRNA synthetase